MKKSILVSAILSAMVVPAAAHISSASGIITLDTAVLDVSQESYADMIVLPANSTHTSMVINNNGSLGQVIEHSSPYSVKYGVVSNANPNATLTINNYNFMKGHIYTEPTKTVNADGTIDYQRNANTVNINIEGANAEWVLNRQLNHASNATAGFDMVSYNSLSDLGKGTLNNKGTISNGSLTEYNDGQGGSTTGRSVYRTDLLVHEDPNNPANNRYYEIPNLASAAGYAEAKANNHHVVANEIKSAGFTNSGTIDLTPADEAGDFLRISSDFTVDGGLLMVNAVLDNTKPDGSLSNYSDMIYVGGDVILKQPMKLQVWPAYVPNGYTQNNTLPEGAHKITVAQVEGNNPDGWLELDGAVTHGVYEYRLAKEGQKWNLVNYYGTGGGTGGGSAMPSVLYNPYISNYMINQQAGMQMFHHSFADRQSAKAFSYTTGGTHDSWHGSMFWINSQFNSMKAEHLNQHEIKSKTQQVQVGMDVVQLADFNAGLFTGYGMADTKTKSKFTQAKTEGKVKGYMIGAYATYAPESTGFYLDGWGYYASFKNELKDGVNNQQKAKYDAQGFALSAEAGYALPIASLGSGDLVLKPHAQLTYSYLDNDKFSDGSTTFVAKDSSGWQTKLGARLEGQLANITPFVEANWVHNAMESVADIQNAQTFKSKIGENVGETKIGLSGNINDNLSVWGNASGRFGSDDYRDYGVQLGVGVRW